MNTLRANSAVARFVAVWSYRDFILSSVLREFQMRYRNSLFGIAWSIINPLTMIAIYTVIFSKIMHSRLPDTDQPFAYSIYLCAGLITWGLFSDILSRSQNVFLDNANLMKKLVFPRICLPLIVVLNAWTNFIIILTLFLLFLAIVGAFPGWPLIALIPVLTLQTLFAVGLGIIVGVVNVFFRDAGHLFTIVLQFWFWLTPVIYPLSALPAWAADIVKLNPMTAVVTAYQTIFVAAAWPDWISLWPAALSCVLTCVLGMALFRARAFEMVDEL
jgi:lipopolysaccharide transport system permease protein